MFLELLDSLQRNFTFLCVQLTCNTLMKDYRSLTKVCTSLQEAPPSIFNDSALTKLTYLLLAGKIQDIKSTHNTFTNNFKKCHGRDILSCVSHHSPP